MLFVATGSVRTCTGAGTDDVCRTAATSAPVSGRAAGSRSSSRATSAETASGTSARDAVTAGGVCTKRREMIAAAVGPVKATSPVSISYSTQPREKRSLRPSSVSPAACSGLM